ncbi:MAG TPA: S8 family peptidase [Vicinamibacterales bacterium]
MIFPSAHSRSACQRAGQRLTAGAALLVIACAFTANADAADRHSRAVVKAAPGAPGGFARPSKLDRELTVRAGRRQGSTTRAIVSLIPGAQLPPEFAPYAKRFARLGIVNGALVDVPNRLLAQLAAHPSVFSVHYDRPVARFNYRTSLAVGTRPVRDLLGLSGDGVTVAVIDSGIASWHDDLTSRSSTLYPFGDQRVAGFVDFVNGRLLPYDDNGHGTHVAGIIAGNGYDSNGQKAGAAPDASLVSLKVIDAAGTGTISSVISALDWVLANHRAYNIRVVNLSVGAAVSESYWTDPLTLAAKRVVDDGVVVVAAAGNFGRNALGLPQYGGITAPANAPWVLTVGASSTEGTPARDDDSVAGFSSRGPTYLDWSAKPDLVAPGTGTVSLLAPASTFEAGKSMFALPGTVPTAALPYLALSGTSMAAPVVSGTVALMLQANPNLTPNAVKAILEYTAQIYPGYDPLTEGAGFLNAVGAVRLARFFTTAQPGDPYPVQSLWSKSITWGNYRLTGGAPLPNVNAWQLGTTWGAARAVGGENIVWGTTCDDGCDNIVWGTAFDDNIVWGTAFDNIVWGTTFLRDNIVWGTSFDNIVWGTDCGGADCDNIVWGTADDDNIVWGTANPEDNIVWGTDDGDNIVWGTAAVDDVVWTTAEDNIVWGTSGGIVTIDGQPGDGSIAAGTFDAMTDQQVFDAALAPPAAVELPPGIVPITDSPPMIVDPRPFSGGALIVIEPDTPTTAEPDAVVADPLPDLVIPFDPVVPPPSDPRLTLSVGGI